MVRNIETSSILNYYYLRN